MKQFFLTVLGVFTGLILFVVVIPVVLLTVAVGGMVEIVPLFTIESTIERVEGVRRGNRFEVEGGCVSFLAPDELQSRIERGEAGGRLHAGVADAAEAEDDA